MNFRGIVALCLSTWIALPASAATIYYVGGIYDFANVRGETPLFAVGEMTIDESKLPAGQSLSGLEFQAYSEIDWEDPADTHRMGPDFFSLRLSHNTGAGIYNSEYTLGTLYGGGDFAFDDTGKPDDWGFEENTLSGTFFKGSGGDGALSYWFDHEAWIDPDHFLTNLGYKAGTKKFNELKEAHTWASGFSSRGGGAWYSDALEFASAVARRTMEAMQSSISNIYTISSCRVADAALSAEDFAPPAAA